MKPAALQPLYFRDMGTFRTPARHTYTVVAVGTESGCLAREISPPVAIPGTAVSAVMKLVFFSHETAEVERACRVLGEVGIACEVRHAQNEHRKPVHDQCVELWLQDERDAYRASIRCAEQEVGFYRRPGKPLLQDTPPERNDEGEE